MTWQDRMQQETERLVALAHERHPHADAHQRDVLEQLAKLGGAQARPSRGPSGVGDAGNYRSYEELVIDRGQLHQWQPRPADVEQLEQRQCYSNAYWLAARRGWTYVEGFAMAMLPVKHAWVLDDAGAVVDPTWPDAVPTGFYLGIPLALDAVGRHITETGYFGVLCNDWRRDNHLLRRGAIDQLAAAQTQSAPGGAA